jgi:hypothetical protein
VPKDKESSDRRLSPSRRRILAGTALALMIGIGVGTWLGKTPRASWGQSSPGQDTLQLRLDDTFSGFVARGQRTVPRDRSASR